jgi:hypothetical protein
MPYALDDDLEYDVLDVPAPLVFGILDLPDRCGEFGTKDSSSWLDATDTA